MAQHEMPRDRRMTVSVLNRIVEWAKRSSFLRLLVVITVVAELLTGILNAINGYVWWGENPEKLFLVGVVDAFLVSIIALPLIIFVIMRLKQAEQESADKSAYLDNILRTSTDLAIAATDIDFRITLFNPAAEEMFGYKASDVMGLDIRRLHSGQGIDDRKFADYLDRFRREGGLSFLFKRGEGVAERLLELRVLGIYNKNGAQAGYVMSARDVTERRKALAALRESEAKFRLLTEESLVGVYIVQDYRFVYVNPRFAEITGYDRDDIVMNKRLDDLITPESMELAREHINRRMSGEAQSAHYEMQGIRSDGSLIDVEVLGSVTTYNGMLAIIGTLIDVTERKKTERALKESEAKFRTLVEHSLIGVAIIQDGRYVYVNPRHAKMLGYTQDEMTSFGSIVDPVHPDDMETVAENVRKRISGELPSIRYQFRFIKKDGSTVHVEVHGSRTKYNGRPAVMGSVLDITESKMAEDKIRKLNEELERRVEERTAELEKAQQDREAMQARLNEVQKMEAVGNFAGGIAHDFNNLLTVIQGDTELAKKLVGEQSPSYECLAQVGRAASRASELIKKLLLFSRRKPMARLPMNINGTVEDVLGILERLIGERITVETGLGPEIWTINADASGMEQVVMNLALNARDAMPDGGRLYIKTGNVELDDEKCMTMEGARPGRFVRLTVSDTGKGMDGETLKRVFEPFFTTKGRGRGTGLGLSVVYGIVKEHGGWINITSVPGRGSTFDVFLEALDVPAE